MGVVDEDGSDVAALAQPIPAQRDAETIAASDVLNAKARVEARRIAAAVRVQALLRRWLARRAYRDHLTRVRADVAHLVAQRNMRCAITVQRVVRGLVCRLRYRRQREEEALAALEAAKGSKGRKAAAAAAGGSGAAAAKAGGAKGLQAILSPQEAALQHNLQFITGVRKFLAGAFDEAVSQFEAQQKAKPEPVTASMVELARRRRDGISTKDMNASLANGGAAAAAGAGGSTNSGAKKPPAKPAPKKK